MRRRPLVSVVVCTYARPEPLRAALASVCVQGVDGVEVVVVNDGGPDVAGVVAEFGDRLPVRLITLPTNEGLTAARRSGIGAARGQFMAFLDDDDLWLPDHLSVALDGLDSEVDLVYTTCLVADRVHHLGSGQPVSARYRFDYPFDAALLDVTNMIPVTSVVARRFDPAMLHRHDGVQDDWAMWLDLVRGAGWRAAHLPVATTVSPCPAGGVDDRASGEHSGRVAQVRRRASADTPAVAGAGRQPGRESSPVAVLDVSAGGTASQRRTWGVPLLL